MKRNKILKNMGRIYLASGLLAMTLLSSCLKDNSPGAVDFSKSPALVAFQYQGFGATPYIAAVLPNAGAVYSNVEVTLSVASITQSTPVTVTVVEDAASLASFNAAQKAADPTFVNFIELPTSDYVLPNGGKVTISPGQQIAKFPITFAGNAIDFTQGYALALKLTNASGAILTTNLNVAIVEMKLKSPFEDTYVVKSGATTRYTGTTAASPLQDSFPVTEATLNYSTVSADEVVGQAGSSLFGLTAAIKIDGTTVHVLADPSAAVGGTTFNYIDGDSKGVSSYDPTTKTLTLHYGYLNGAGHLREVDMVLVGE